MTIFDFSVQLDLALPVISYLSGWTWASLMFVLSEH